MKVKVYRVELLIMDFDGIGADEVEAVIESAHYPNRCINPKVMRLYVREVEWNDDHPLNKWDTQARAFRELFKPQE